MSTSTISRIARDLDQAGSRRIKSAGPFFVALVAAIKPTGVPDDVLAVTNSTYQKKKATSRVKNGLSEIWLPGRDSNPRPIG